ncbi:MAG: DUF4062 domain-containing protein [Clostridiales bacterium]|nr:DUF4062 domain-containing protein [Clostridiales bacterium]
MGVLRKEDIDLVRRQYGRSLHRRLSEAAERLEKQYMDLRLCEVLHPQTIERAQKAYADVPAESMIAIDTFAGGGKNGIILAEDGVYTSHVGRIPFAGLEQYSADEDGLCLLLAYSDGTQVKKFQFQVNEVVDLLRAALDIYGDLSDRIQNGSTVFSLNSVEGWKEFTDQKNRRLLESKRNSVFVSSTFKDMHYERDAIHEKVLPALNEIAADYGQNLSFCDLRWGVNTAEMESEEGSRKVLSVCLHEIERCQPYMVVILGERYGWIPEKDMVKETVSGWFDEELDELDKSVTALEIEFGALSRDARLNRTLFYFREIKGKPSDIYRSEDEIHAKKLANLKRRIQKLAPGRVKKYTLEWDERGNCPKDLDDFARMVTEDIRQLMEGDWKDFAELSLYEKEQRLHWNYAAQKAMQCAARDKFLREVLEELEIGAPLTILRGASGSGKSTLVGTLAEVLRLSHTEVCPLFCTHTERSDTVEDVMWNLICFLEGQLQILHDMPLNKQKNTMDDEGRQKTANCAEQQEREALSREGLREEMNRLSL